MVILIALYCLIAGITMCAAFLLMGLFKREQYIIKWSILSALFGLIWPISVPSAFLWIYLPKK